MDTLFSAINELNIHYPFTLQRNMYPLRSSFLTVVSALFATTLAAHAATWPCDPSTGLTSFPFCDTSLAMETRAKDLVSRLSLAEKAQQLIDNAAGVPRLGIPSYQWWSEALHGVSNVGRGGTKFNATVPGATVFPIPLHSAASFNATLWQDIGKAVSTEARAMNNVGLAGLTFWSPTMNVVRDPRWGRTQETPGEDPYTVGKYSAAYVRGLQGYGDQSNTSRRLKVASCCKHYTAYDLDNWKGIQRYTFNAVVTEQDLEDTYNPPFKACVLEGNVASIMCSYNKVNGVPTCANPELLAGTIRGKWGLDGYIVSDCDSVDVFYRNQKFAATPEDAVALAINAGLDLNCGSFLAQHTVDAVNKGKVNESKVDQALVNNYIVLMRLGWFDGNPAKQLYGNLGPTDVCTTEHRALALQAAREGVVLLKNVNDALPLTATGTVAVIGPNANATVTMIGNYAGIACRYTTPVQGISAYTKTVYAPGCKDVLCKSNSLVSAAVKTASKADATVLVVGGDQSLEAESRDRTSFLLPGYQQSLVKSVADASPGPVVLVIMSGGPFDISFALDDPKISAIFWVGYPGETGGVAIADTIFGAYNPSGRLPVSWYPEEYTKIPMTNMNMRPDPSTGYPGRTYRFYTGKTLFQFGDGLSYTKFHHSLKSLVLSKKESCVVREGMVCKIAKFSRNGCHDLRMEAVLEVRNVGKRDGDHVVMFYSTPPAGDGVPKKHLVGFGKVHVKAKGRERVRFSADVCNDVAVVDKGGKRKLSAGSYVFEFGDLQHPFQVSLGDKYEILETTMEEI